LNITKLVISKIIHEKVFRERDVNSRSRSLFAVTRLSVCLQHSCTLLKRL